MKKLILALAIFGLSAGAHAAKKDKMFDYWSAGMAMENISNYTDGGFAFIANAHKNYPDVHENFSIEGAFSYTLSPASYSFFTSKVESKVMSLGGYGVYTHQVDKDMSVHGRLGLAYASVESTASGCSICSGKGSSTDLSFGVGADYKMDKEKTLFATWRTIKEITHIGAGVKMKF